MQTGACVRYDFYRESRIQSVAESEELVDAGVQEVADASKWVSPFCCKVLYWR